VLAAE
jgi:hypothetical protein